MRQLASPIGLKLSRFLPSNSTTQPASAWPDACCEYEKAATPTNNIAAAAADQRFIAFLPWAGGFTHARGLLWLWGGGVAKRPGARRKRQEGLGGCRSLKKSPEKGT